MIEIDFYKLLSDILKETPEGSEIWNAIQKALQNQGLKYEEGEILELKNENDRIKEDLINFFEGGGFLYHKSKEIVDFLKSI
jgi:hypothetical protein